MPPVDGRRERCSDRSRGDPDGDGSVQVAAGIDTRNIQNDGQQIHWMPDCRGCQAPSLQSLGNLFQEQVVSWDGGNTSIPYHLVKHLEWQRKRCKAGLSAKSTSEGVVKCSAFHQVVPHS